MNSKLEMVLNHVYLVGVSQESPEKPVNLVSHIYNGLFLVILYSQQNQRNRMKYGRLVCSIVSNITDPW